MRRICLDAGDPNKEQDKFKTGVIDTIVSMVQALIRLSVLPATSLGEH
jgi:hypothetical protein